MNTAAVSIVLKKVTVIFIISEYEVLFSTVSTLRAKVPVASSIVIYLI